MGTIFFSIELGKVCVCVFGQCGQEKKKEFGTTRCQSVKSPLIPFIFKFIWLKNVSSFSHRLFLREFCIEILGSAFNNLVRQVRRVLERSTTGNDDSYLLWAIRFFLEFNRLNDFQLQLVR